VSDVGERLDDLRSAGLHRRLRLVESPQGPRVTLDGTEVLHHGRRYRRNENTF